MVEFFVEITVADRIRPDRVTPKRIRISPPWSGNETEYQARAANAAAALVDVCALSDPRVFRIEAGETVGRWHVDENGDLEPCECEGGCG